MQGLKDLVEVSDADYLSIYEKVILSQTHEGEYILVPYMSMGNFAFEAAINERKCLIYDDNPLIKINFESEFFYPSFAGIRNRLAEIKITRNFPDCGVKCFLDSKTYDEVMSIRTFLDSAPRDSLNLWIKRLVSETLKMPQVINNAISTPQYFDVKELVLRTYKAVLSNVDPMKILILHYYVPNFFDNESALDAMLNGRKVKMAYYAPYTFDPEAYFEKHLLKMWFSNISKEHLNSAQVSKARDENCEKKNFLSLHKKLEGGGMIFVEKTKDYNLEGFFKLALFYGYENLKAFRNTKGNAIYLLRKLGSSS
ncbi:hypothetical protein [Helicobacter turcicus]|uniref:Uncharacterized protein n=1 Tax=Helicobacter turcicus TaxID=2867412 RepID=A0ABS7JNS4_9HELI|nr:hypothetical protein [Helicobacter turcicus]MBX7491065.1 hypothetical protein [Helicobacter turcicus]MBX7546326.1 hypothetical protein [Helicobacter turcicus]